ncbi:folate receptor gamma [Folsomia candida]|uniref:Folate receptor beta n=1 Tax=Folsomia candida TaxID=158441 RepID=A0A226EVC4_FOLCA|nr:folate receptor gamma [Folsomia candida]OXA60546.1 Folate receptor beta [Folsomia candida]
MATLKVTTLLVVVMLLPLLTNSIQVNVDYSDPRYDKMLNTCIDSKNHKVKPGPEDKLHNQCSPWKRRSCCTHQTTHDAHHTKMYNFDWNHCSQKKNLSDKCRRHFIQDLCFYECSPNMGPWTVKVNNKFRKERFYKVPLCASDCTTWFEDCAEDMTCTDNWVQNMEWVPGLGNRCPGNSSCHTFAEIYRTSKNFCETVWDHSWEVKDDNQHCMRLWFNSSIGNPNDAVARWKTVQIFQAMKGGGGSRSVTWSSWLSAVVVVAMTNIFARL